MLSNNAQTVSYGRGRARVMTKDIEVPLRRPGENLPCKNNESSCGDIIEAINNLNINDPITMKSIVDIFDLVNDLKDIEKISDELYAHSLEDKVFGTKLARLYSDKSFYTNAYNKCTNIRHLLLSYMQKNYERREEIRKENEMLFRNNVSLLGELYSLRPYTVITIALTNCLNMLLETATEEDIEIITIQVIMNGKNLYEDKLKTRVTLNEFILNVRKTLVNNTLSTSAKRMLLLIIDLANQQFNSLPKDLYDYYTSNLSKTVLIHFLKQQDDVTQNTFTNDTRNCIAGAQEKQILKPKKPSKANDTSLVMNTDKTNLTTENTVPRAIRGPGASDVHKSNKTHLKSFTSPPSHSTKNKGWGHDDRFETDYE